jgi:hypothetical protein
MKTFSMLVFLFVCGFLLRAQQAPAGFPTETGNELLLGMQSCDEANKDTPSAKDSLEDHRRQTREWNYCWTAMGYVRGVTDVNFGSFPNSFTVKRNQITFGQIWDVIHQYLTAHPEKRQKLSVELILQALAGAWGTPETKKLLR